MQQRTQRYALISGLVGVGVCVYLSRGNGQEAVPAANQGGQQSSAMQQLLHSSNYPLRLQLKSLNGDWRRLSLGGQAEAGVHMELASSLADNVYYTRGETTTIGSETYLVAYQIENPNKYATPLSVAFNTYQAQRLTPDTYLTLNLVNLRTTTGLYDITQLNVQDEIRRTNNSSSQLGTLPSSGSSNP